MDEGKKEDIWIRYDSIVYGYGFREIRSELNVEICQKENYPMGYKRL